ncbi:MAG: hypothetical protein IJ538_00910 [Clostridia bacterium]|nr:hypothetical protein [Clostridia bacterium]
MSKKEIIKTLDISASVCLLVATLLVLIYQFVGEALVMKFGIVFYVATFLIAIVFFALRLSEKPEQIENADELIKPNKSSKTWLIVRLVLSCIMFAFALTILILF